MLIPKNKRQRNYFPSFFTPRRHSEQAIVALVAEAYVNRVSTRKVDRLVEQLGIVRMTKDRVSALCQALDEQVEVFRCRPLEEGTGGDFSGWTSARSSPAASQSSSCAA